MLDIFRTLPGLLDDIEGAELVREAVVFAAWRRITGEGLADHTAPVKFEKGRLHIAVSSFTWQRHLKDLCAQMVFKLNAVIGTPTVNFIELRIDEQKVLDERTKRGGSGTMDFGADAEKEISPEMARAAESIGDAE